MPRLRHLSPTWLLGFATVLTLSLCIWLGWQVYQSSVIVEQVAVQDKRLYELRGLIVYLDEVLTMSARMATTTGDSKWIDRYETYVPQLDAAIQETLGLVPPDVSLQIKDETDAANIRLVELETAALALVRQGQAGKAQQIVFSDEYEEQKQIYAHGIEHLLTYVQRQTDERLQSERQQTRFVIGTLLVALPVLLLLWLMVLGLLRAGSAARDELLIVQTREKTFAQSLETQEAIIAERTADLQHALRNVEDREERLQQTLIALQESQNAIQALSAPILPIKQGVLVAPLIGAVDHTRAASLMEKVLHEVQLQRAQTLILDVTGVHVIDRLVGQAIFSLASAVRLLGGTVLLVGIRPEVAQTMVHMQLDFSSIAVYASLQEAMSALSI